MDENNNSNLNGLMLGGKRVGSISLNGKSIWSKKCTVKYFDNNTLSHELSSIEVDFMKPAPNMSSIVPELEKKQFWKWDKAKELQAVKTDLSTYPLYKLCCDVTYLYSSDMSELSTVTYLEGDYVNYIEVPAKKNYTISNFTPENSFDISPIKKDVSVLVNDIKNEVKYKIMSVYEFDALSHLVLVYDVHSEPGDSQISTYYADGIDLEKYKSSYNKIVAICNKLNVRYSDSRPEYILKILNVPVQKHISAAVNIAVCDNECTYSRFRSDYALRYSDINQCANISFANNNTLDTAIDDGIKIDSTSIDDKINICRNLLLDVHVSTEDKVIISDIINWKLISKMRKNPGYDIILMKFVGNNIEDTYTKTILSVGDAKQFNIDFITRTYDETSVGISSVPVYEGDSLVTSGIETNTISSTFNRWSSEKYIKVHEDYKISAQYKPTQFTVTYFNALSDIVDKQTFTYGLSSVPPTELVQSLTHNHLYWVDVNSNIIEESSFLFISSDMSAYSFQALKCKIGVFKQYADKTVWLSNIEMLSGDKFDVLLFLYSGLFDVDNMNPRYKFICCSSDIDGDYLSALYNKVVFLYGTGFYDYDNFRAKYMMKFGKYTDKLSCQKLILNNENDGAAIAEYEYDLDNTFYTEYELTYKNETNSVVIKYGTNKFNSRTTAVEDENDVQYAYDNSKLHDRTMYVMKYKKGSDKVEVPFELNTRKVYTQVIELNDLLLFQRLNVGESSFKMIFDELRCCFEYKTDANDNWLKYESNTELTSTYVYIRAITLNVDLTGCNIQLRNMFLTPNTSLCYLTSKYGEKILSLSYYQKLITYLDTTDEKTKDEEKPSEDSTPVLMSASANLKQKTKNTKKKTNKTRKRKTNNAKNIHNISVDI